MFGIFGGGSGLTPAQMAGAYEVCKSGRNRTDSGDSMSLTMMLLTPWWPPFLEKDDGWLLAFCKLIPTVAVYCLQLVLLLFWWGFLLLCLSPILLLIYFCLFYL
ncbi:hypothetical protein [Parasutterella sp.]|jgi:hypothetical protein|uniref:hypothetical protein n=1 Tax=Parasutterella sp. TaxID=2049037 RepID=UPI003520A30C